MKTAWYVYILQCSDATLYTGITQDVTRRLTQHNGAIKGGAKYTRNRRPVKCVYTKRYMSRSKALKQEYEIKHKLSRAEKLRLIKGK